MIWIQKTALVMGAVAGLSVLGCKTHVPMVETYAGSYQKKAQAVYHWERMAKEVAAALSTDPKFHNIPIHMVPTHSSLFHGAYFELLQAELAGVPWMVLVDDPDAASLYLSITPQLISHGRRGFVGSAVSPVGAVGYGLEHVYTGNRIGTESGTRKELLVTISMRTGDGTLGFGMSQIVYIDPGDVVLYLEPASPFVLRATNQN